jgi:hypothetical protein
MRLTQKTIALAAVLAAGIALFGPAPRAHAILVLEGTVTPASGPAITVWATDNNVAYPGGAPSGPNVIQLLDTNGTTGILALAPGTILPGYAVQSSTNFSVKGTGSLNDLNSSALQIQNTTGGTVTTNINVGDNGFIGPASVAFASASGTWNNAVGSHLNVSFFDDPQNRQPLMGPTFAPVGNQIAQSSKDVTQVSDSFSFASGPIAVNDPGNFSMTLHFDFTLVNGGTFVSRGQDLLKIVPEPAGLAMALSGLPVVGLLLTRRRRG